MQSPLPPLITSASPTDIEAERIAFYKDRKIDELNSFIKKRTEPAKREAFEPILNRPDARCHLLQLDRQTSFRFLDLPKDIRLMVEEELLMHTPGKRLHSQILSTCKTINDEAQGFHSKSLRRGNMQLVRFHEDLGSCGCPHCACGQVPGSHTIRYGTATAQTLGPVQRIHKELESLPRISSRTTSLFIDVVFESQCSQRSGYANELINGYLNLLATAVQDSNLESVSVRIIAPDTIAFFQATTPRMLWPVTRFGPNINVTISGISNEVLESLQAEQEKSSYAVPALTPWLKIKAAADELVDVVRRAGLTNTDENCHQGLLINSRLLCRRLKATSMPARCSASLLGQCNSTSPSNATLNTRCQ